MRTSAIVLAIALGVLLAGSSAAVHAHGGEHKKKAARSARPGAALGADYAPKVNWHTLEKGRALALKEKKGMIVDFSSGEGCERCEFLQNNVYNRDEIVDKINSDFVPIYIDIGGVLTYEEASLGNKYDFHNDCLMLFLDYQGNVIKDPDGKKMCFIDEIEPQVFIEYLDYVIANYIPG